MIASLATSFLAAFVFVALLLTDCATAVLLASEWIPPQTKASENAVTTIKINFPEMGLSAFINGNKNISSTVYPPNPEAARVLVRWGPPGIYSTVPETPKTDHHIPA